MGAGSTAKRRRTGTDSSANSTTPSRAKAARSGRGRGRPPNAPRDGRERPPPLGECFRRRCTDVLDRLNKKDHHNIFLEPVNTDEVDGYAETIKRPMDLTTMRTKLGKQAYRSLGEFRRDLDLIWSNCLLFNGKEPTNIFSQTAIELRRLTDKLIATTRQHLEKDKDNILKWKEKHKRRRETMQANTFPGHGLHPQGGLGPLGYGGRDSRTSASGRDPMDASAPTFQREENNGRTPEESALADYLRLQYAGTTGLYRKGMETAPLPQYPTSDGSLAEILVNKYHPSDSSWGDGRSVDVALHHFSACPELLCERLPLPSTRNPCAPQPRRASILVKDYAHSLYSFVQNTNSVTTTQIVTEFLSPELAVKKEQEEVLKKGMTLHDLAMMKSRANARSVSDGMKTWDTKAIVELADRIEKANKMTVSILPKLRQPRAEMDGIRGLEQVLGEEIAKEVDAVPVEIVAFSMSHGVSVATMDEIGRLQNAPALGISANDLHCIDTLRKQVQSYAQRRRPDTPVSMDAASNLTQGQLHEMQLRSLSIKQQIRAEAHKQASLIAQGRHSSPTHRPSNISVHKRELEFPSEKRQRSNAFDGRLAGRAGHPNYMLQPSAQSQEVNHLLKARAQQAAVAAAKAASLGGRQNRVAMNRALSHSVGVASQRTGYEMPPANQNSVCKNCGTRDTFGWKASGHGPEEVERLCIPCGLYWEKAHRHRPKELWAQTSHRTSRTPSSGSAANGLASSRGFATVSPLMSPISTPNGISKRPIQKVARVLQSSPKHSPSSAGSHGNIPNTRVSVGALSFPQGMQATHSNQHLLSTQNDIRGMHQQVVRPQMNNTAQMLTGHGSNSNGTTVIPSQAIQAIQGGRNAGSDAFSSMGVIGGNGGGRTNVNIQPGVQAQIMYRGQTQGGRVAPQQQFVPLRTTGQQNLMALQNNQLIQQKLMNQQVGRSSVSMGLLGGENPVVTQTQDKNNASIMSMNGIVQNTTENAQFTTMQHSGLSTSAAQHGATTDVSEERGQRNILGDTGGMPTGLDFSNLSSFANQGGMGSGMVSGLGDAGTRSAFANNSNLGGDVMGSDQLGDMFLDGALETPSGGPDFSF